MNISKKNVGAVKAVSLYASHGCVYGLGIILGLNSVSVIHTVREHSNIS